MKAARFLAGALRSTKIVFPTVLTFLLVIIVLGVLEPIRSPEWVSKADAAAVTPQPSDRDAALDVALTPSFPVPASGLPGAALAVLPDLNSPENAPRLPAIRPAAAVSGDAVNQGLPCSAYGYPDCWTKTAWSGLRSSCSVNLGKRALVVGLVYPFYKWNIPLIRGDAWVYHRFWVWDPASSQWTTRGWEAPNYQAANYYYTDYGDVGTGQYVFQQKLHSPFATTTLVGGSAPLMLTTVLQGLNGPRWIAIQRHVYLSRLHEPHLSVPSWVTFDNGSNYCGYNFSLSAQAGAPLEEAPLVAASAPPPPDSGPPGFSFLPLIVRSAPSGPTPTPTPQPTPQATPDIPLPPTPSSPPTTGDMQNGNFEAGRNVGWTEYSSRGFIVVQPGPKGFTARSGEYLAWLGGAHSDTSSISQTLTVPTSHPYLSLYLMATSEEESCNYDRATIWVDEYQVASIGLCKPQNFHSWLRNQIDMRDFAGETVAFTIKVETDDSLLSSVFVDDLSFESGVMVPTPAPTPTPSSGTIRNPGFELGDNGDWASYTLSGQRNIFRNDGAHSGSWLAWLGGLHDEVGYIEQTVDIPHDKPYLTYWGWISSEETSCGGDQVSFLSGSTELYGYSLCEAYNNTRWGQGWVNLAAYAGTTQRIRIKVQTNGSLLSSLYLDDFAFAATPPTSSLSVAPDAQTAGEQALPSASGVAPPDVQAPAREPESKEPAR